MEKRGINKEGERLSFYKLFAEKHYKLVVPIIQREYAQGRTSDDVKEVRHEFLDALYDYLETNIPERDLDFVYGNLINTDGETQFVPLDGQQRLTTLFLLHWYLYNISNNESLKATFLSNMTNDGHSMFSYETRITATDFCNSLMCNQIDVNKLHQNDADEKPSVSATIKNKNWYYRTWDYDPTIQSMLVMLDSIHEKFNAKPEFFDRLVDIENPVITFLFMDLQKYKLTDDLYIKMNSRGKQLTPLENFKAKYEQYLKTVSTSKSYTLAIGGSTQDVSLSKYFSFNIDTKWTNLFWNFRELRSYKEDYDHFDDLIANFIRVIFTNSYAGEVMINLKGKDDALDKLSNNGNDHLSFNLYYKLNALSEDGALYLVDALDALSTDGERLPSFLPENYSFYYNEEDMFKKAIENKLYYAERMQFHAYLQYLIRYKDRSGLADWMRVIHNLSDMENTITNQYSYYAAGIKSINKLLPHANHILEYLASDIKIDYFSSWQVEEEIVKAKLILRNDGWRELIEETEKHGYFNGQIGFILDFANVFKIGSYDWDKSVNDRFQASFKNYQVKASLLFADSYDNRINNKDFCLERAAMTKGNYYLWTSSHTFNMLSSNKVTNNVKRDYSWRRLLRATDTPNPEGYRILKSILDDHRFDINDITGSLESIASDGYKGAKWVDILIKNPSLIGYAEQGFIGPYEENGIMLLKSLKSNATHWELYTSYLWELLPEVKDYLFELEYVESTDKEIEPYIRYYGFTYERKKYEFRIYGRSDWEHNYDFEFYEIQFLKSDGKKNFEEYSESITRCLESNGFEWLDHYDDGTIMRKEDLGFYYDATNEEEALLIIKKLCESLDALK